MDSSTLLSNTGAPMLSIAQIKTVDYSVSGMWAEYEFASRPNLAVLLFSYEDGNSRYCRGINEEGETIEILLSDFKILEDA